MSGDKSNETVLKNNCDGAFSFDKVVDFDSHIGKSIPSYQVFCDIARSMFEYFARPATNVYDIGCSTGILLKSLPLLKDMKKYGIYKSDNLLPKDEEGCNFLNVNLDEYFCFNNASFIYSLFTFQFISQKNRLDLMKNIYNGLNKGGAFLFCEKTYSGNVRINDILTFLYYDFKAKSFSEAEILKKERDLRHIMQPLPRVDNEELLREAGFKHFDLVFKHFGFEAILAIK